MISLAPTRAPASARRHADPRDGKGRLRQFRRIAAAALLALTAVPAAAQQPAKPAPTSYQRGIAAGYRALMLCGAIFDGGRTQAQAEALELTGIYPITRRSSRRPAQELPAGSYAAQGNRGQFDMVIPWRKLVIVRRGEDAAGAPFDIARFSADVLAALP